MKNPNLSILIVDDDHANLRILSATFEDHGFRVYSASSGEQAQDQLNEQASEIELVLSDIQMPGCSGLDLLKWIKSARAPIKDIPVLLITSQLPDSASRVLGLSLGAVDYITRSLDAEEIVIRVTHAIEHYTQIRALRFSLETTENLASTGRLFAASNHEIKNVSQIISMATGILKRELNESTISLSETCKKALAMLEQSTGLLTGMTKMIDGVIGSQDITSRQIDLGKVVENVVLMTTPLLKGHTRLSFSPCSVGVLGNETFLTQVLLNLIINARDAIEELGFYNGGRGEIKIDIGFDETLVFFTVIDNGVGLQTCETRTSFPPFSSTKQLRGGTGLGLWLSSHLVEKMSGSLSLSSSGPNLGAQAKVTLKKVGG